MATGITSSGIGDLDVFALENTRGMLECFMQSHQFQELSEVEKTFLGKYSAAHLDLATDPQSVAAELREMTGINESGYLGSSTVSAMVKHMYTAGVEIKFFINKRPYLFFHRPDTNSFYFFKNEDPTKEIENIDLQVLDIKEGVWKRVVDLTPFEGNIDQQEVAQYDGAIKANDFVLFFNQTKNIDAPPSVTHREETVAIEGPDKPYYQEYQTEGGFCAIHAANAFIGSRVVIPSKLQQFVTLKAQDFSQEGVEGLAQGVDSDFEKLFDIQNGSDIGMIVDYLNELNAAGSLPLDISNLQSGGIKIINDELVFQPSGDGDVIPLTEGFLNSIERSLFGTLIPAHAMTLRKRTDNTWTRIDAFQTKQHDRVDLVGFLRKEVEKQIKYSGSSSASLPFAFL